MSGEQRWMVLLMFWWSRSVGWLSSDSLLSGHWVMCGVICHGNTVCLRPLYVTTPSWWRSEQFPPNEENLRLCSWFGCQGVKLTTKRILIRLIHWLAERFCLSQAHLAHYFSSTSFSTASPHPNHAGKPCLKLKVYVKPTSKSCSNCFTLPM